MVSTVKPRPNFYEMLGLSPSASANEIERAFANEMSMFRPRALGETTALGVAFDTLRDPAKRRAYDASLGLNATPPATEWSVPKREPLVTRLTQTPSQTPPPPKKPAPQREAPSEDRLASFLAQSLRGPVAAATSRATREPAAERPAPVEAAGPPRMRPARGAGSVSAMLLGADEDAADERDGAWKRPALAVGGLVLAVGLFGATVAWWSGGGSSDEPQLAEPAVTATLPAAQPQGTATVPAPELPQAVPAATAQIAAPAPAPAAATPARREPAPQPPKSAASDAQPTGDGAVAEVTLPPSTAEQAPVEEAAAAEPAAPAAPPAASAKLPLPNATIARTIEKIGYACGAVDSIASAGGAGVFKVTCTSGQSYQARPVNGRYHFRKWGSH